MLDFEIILHNEADVGTFAKSQKATISFILSVRPSFHMKQLCSHWTYFYEIWYPDIFRKSVEKG